MTPKEEHALSIALYAEAKRLRAKKRFSQNFLFNAPIINRIVRTVDLQPDETLVEIGPGIGFLTQQLLQAIKDSDPNLNPEDSNSEKSASKLIGIELERQMIFHLKNKFAENPYFQLIENDILKYDFSDIEAEQFKIVGNLPYNISSPILFHLAGELNNPNHPLRQRIQHATLMVQKEVGERICAKPNEKGYNALTIAVQYWFETNYEFTVPNHSFHPQPKVESAIITLSPRLEPLTPISDLNDFSRLIKAAFHQRRKTLRNALAPFAEQEILDKIFTQVSAQFKDDLKDKSGETQPIQSKRAQELSIEMLGALANAYTEQSR